MKKRFSESHTPPSPKGSGDHYGTGIRQKIGTIQRDYINDVIPSKKTKNPPKALA